MTTELKEMLVEDAGDAKGANTQKHVAGDGEKVNKNMNKGLKVYELSYFERNFSGWSFSKVFFFS